MHSEESLVGDALLELAKAKELASVLGGAWHDDEDIRDEEKADDDMGDDEGLGSQSRRSVHVEGPRLLGKWRHESKDTAASNGAGAETENQTNSGVGAKDDRRSRRKSVGRGRPADGRSPGRRDPVALAKAEAEAEKRKAAEEAAAAKGLDKFWQLPTNVDYYTDRAALLRELIKDMPADKRLSFQTRVANARSKEEVGSVLDDFASRLACLVLPDARSRDVDLQQVKKDTARERVILNGEEIAFWGSPSDQPNSWHDELWATVEGKVMEGLVGGNLVERNGLEALRREGVGLQLGEEETKDEAVDKARWLAAEEWNKARAVAATSEVFKAMSRTGAGGDAYFALVALFCTADKMVVPVHCQESPITVEFCSPTHSARKGMGAARQKKGTAVEKAAGKVALEEDVRVVVTVPSTFDIYLRDKGISAQRALSVSSSGHPRGVSNGGRPRGMGSGAIVRSSSAGAADSDPGGADAAAAQHLVRVRAVVEEDIRVIGSARPTASALQSGRQGRKVRATAEPPSLRFLLQNLRGGSSAPRGVPAGVHCHTNHLHPPGASSAGLASRERRRSASPDPSSPSALQLSLTRRERRMRVSVVPEPSAMTTMVRQFTRKMGGGTRGLSPPRVLGQ